MKFMQTSQRTDPGQRQTKTKYINTDSLYLSSIDHRYQQFSFRLTRGRDRM